MNAKHSPAQEDRGRVDVDNVSPVSVIPCGNESNLTSRTIPDEEGVSSNHSSTVNIRSRRDYRSDNTVNFIHNEEPTRQTMHSVVFMSEQGAEVTLSQSFDASLQPTPTRTQPATPAMSRRRRASGRSLLDDETATSPTPEQRTSRNMFFCDGAGCYKPEFGPGQALEATRASVEKTIKNLLGSPVGLDDWCNGWQAWTYFEMDTPFEDETIGLKENVRQVLRNRASSSSARLRRIHALKMDLHPFDTPSPDKRDAMIAKAFSFSEDFGGGVPSTSPYVIYTRGTGASDAFYDSDPEETTKRRGARTRVNCLEGKRLFDDCQKAPTIKTIADLDNEQQVKIFVQEIINDKFTLIWHPSSASRGSSAPVAVTAWIERGQQLSNTLIHPKFVWKQRQQASDQHGPAAMKPYPLYSLELLDVVRILELNRIDRRSYPLAHRKKSLLMESLEHKMVFETNSEAERNRLVSGLKVLVARLASKIITDDGDVFAEFFLPSSANPGDLIGWDEP